MKKLLFGIIAIASMAMTGCTQEVEQIVMDDMKNVKFIGTIEDVDTRTSMDNTGKVIWCKDDSVSIFMRNGNHYKYQANSGGTTKTTFAYANWYAKGTASLGQNYAVYPFDEDNAFDAATKKFTVDLSGLADQTYTENNFEEGKSVMTAKASDTDLPFYNALSMLNVRLSSSVPEVYRITEIKIESATKALSGEGATIDLSGEDGKVAAVLESGEQAISLNCGEGGVVISTDPTDFYILVPVNDIPADDFTITITAINGFTGEEYTADERINKDFSFERSKIVTYERTLTAEDWKGSIEDVIGNNDIVLKEDHAEVFSANGLLKWAYIANNSDNSYGLKLMNDIKMPEYEIEEDAVNETYRFTEKAITVTDGVPSGSNWIPVCTYVTVESDGYKGDVDGGNHTISGLFVKAEKNYVGFIGFMYDGGSVKNLVVENANVSGVGSVGAIVGRSQHNTLVENVQVKMSEIKGTDYYVGGIVGRNYSRNVSAQGDVYNEELAIIKNCSIDENSTVYSIGPEVGGVCGSNNGAAVIYCVNNADVTGKTLVGGVVGMNRPYNTGREGYVIACSSTANATIHATSQNAGGIVGQAFKDNKQENTIGYIVACFSLSTVTGNNNATLVGSSTNGTIRSSWAVKNGLTSYAHILKGGTFERIYSEHFDTAEDVNAEFVNGMNQAIADYNNIEGIEITCPYTWSWTSGSWPVLVEQ